MTTSGLECGIFVAPIETPGYLLAAVRYSFPVEANGVVVQQATSPMAGLIIPMPAVSIILAMIQEMENWVTRGKEHGFPQPFYCGEVDSLHIMYSVATDRYMVGLALVAGYFSSLAALREPLEQTVAAIQERSPWPVSAPKWLQRFSNN